MSDEKLEIADNYLCTDTQFNELYPYNIQLLAKRHWTPLRIARWTTEFLTAAPGCKILDIGSGVGKFCLAGALYAPDALFYGVEQRQYLIGHAVAAKRTLGLNNVSFIHGNFTQLDFRQYDHFYFFNSFYENLDEDGRIDYGINYSEALYEYYARNLYNGLKVTPSGTKVVTYHTLWHEIPNDYRMVESLENGALTFWIKK